MSFSVSDHGDMMLMGVGFGGGRGRLGRDIGGGAVPAGADGVMVVRDCSLPMDPVCDSISMPTMGTLSGLKEFRNSDMEARSRRSEYNKLFEY
jgi:hypothetical protein